jgi:hypothetical protein
MNDLITTTSGVTHQLYSAMLRLTDRALPIEHDVGSGPRDRGAVSLEQVLWFVAAGVSVAVIAAILWGQIRDQAEKTPIDPSAP